jgi:hypothetical protein
MAGNDSRVPTAELNVLIKGAYMTASCRITGIGEPWNSGPLDNIPIDRAMLDGKITELRGVLTVEHTEIWAGLNDPLAPAPNDYVAGKFKECVERVVTKGAALYGALCDSGLREILEKIDSTLKDGDRLTVQTNCAFLPWEILYPHKYSMVWPGKFKDQNPLRPRSLWGYKYQIEYSLLTTLDENQWEPPYAEHETGKGYVSLNLNKAIEAAFSNRPFKPIKFHEDFYDASIKDRGDLVEDGDGILSLLLSAENEASIIYLFCHGSSTSPLADQSSEVLELDPNKRIEPYDLNYGNTYLRGPIVILNSCLSAAVSPLSFSSFHTQFRKKRAMGVIGTTIQMPATFAAAFGRKIIEHYLLKVPIGKALYLLRRELLERDNPLGLFYSLQCPGHITAPKGGSN